MTTAFSNLIADARQFFAELAQDNSKDWFHANKSRYDTLLKSPALDVLEALKPHVVELAGSEVKTKLFRAHRDVRFSKDKSPYNLHLHMLWAPQGTDTSTGAQPAYFFGIANDYVTAGGGIMGFDKTQQANWRAFVSEREGAALQTKIDALIANGGRMDPPELKRVPSPFDANHPQAELLRRKSCVVWTSLAGSQNITAGIEQAFAQINPILDDLRAFL